MDIKSKNNPSTLMTQVAYESKLRSVVKVSMRLCPGNWVAVELEIVYYARAAQDISARIECRHFFSQATWSLMCLAYFV